MILMQKCVMTPASMENMPEIPFNTIKTGKRIYIYFTIYPLLWCKWRFLSWFLFDFITVKRFCTFFAITNYISILVPRVERFRIPNYMGVQKDLNQQMRAILVDWMVEVQVRLSFEKISMYISKGGNFWRYFEVTYLNFFLHVHSFLSINL